MSKGFAKTFPILKRKINDNPLIYFDNAATTQKPRQVIDAENDYYEQPQRQRPPSCAHASQEATELHENAREKIANLLTQKNPPKLYSFAVQPKP